MNQTTASAQRRCHDVLNSLHSTVYFTPHFDKELAELGVTDAMAAYLMGRAAPLGAVGAGTVSATFYSFAHRLVARHLPAAWAVADPATVLAARLRAVDATLRQFLDAKTISSSRMVEAADLALRATTACARPARPLYAAHADLPVPDEAHLALWHAATLLREHRGDSHLVALLHAELDGLEALVSHSATDDGMPPAIVMTKRGWTAQDWAAAQGRLRERGLMDGAGRLTPRGVELRRELEAETDRLDRAPYRHLGAAGVERLTELVATVTTAAARADVFPAPLRHIFVKG